MTLQQRISLRIKQLNCIENSPRSRVEFMWHQAIANEITELQSQNERMVRALERLMEGSVVTDGQVIQIPRMYPKDVLNAHETLTEIKKGQG